MRVGGERYYCGGGRGEEMWRLRGGCEGLASGILV